MGNRRKRGHRIESYDQFYLNNCKMPNAYKTSSMTFLPVHLYAYENNDLNADNVKLTEDSTVEPKIVLSESMSIEKNEVLTVSSAYYLPTTERPVRLMSNCFKQKQYLSYYIREYSHYSKVFTPTAIKVEIKMAKKPQCLPPLGPPPILHPPPPKRPPLPSCPRKKEKKKKFATLDKRCLLINRPTTRFIGYHQPEDQNLATWRALSARSSKSVLDKASKGYIF